MCVRRRFWWPVYSVLFSALYAKVKQQFLFYNAWHLFLYAPACVTVVVRGAGPVCKQTRRVVGHCPRARWRDGSRDPPPQRCHRHAPLILIADIKWQTQSRLQPSAIVLYFSTNGEGHSPPVVGSVCSIAWSSGRLWIYRVNNTFLRNVNWKNLSSSRK